MNGLIDTAGGLGTTALITCAIAAVVVLMFVLHAARRIARTEKFVEKLVAPVMLGGMIWSAEAVWKLTADVNIGVRIATFAVLEFMLLIAMARAKDCVKVEGHPGRSGQTAWVIALLIAVVAFAAGAFLYHSVVEAILRPIIPLMLTKVWWDGILGEGQRRPGSFKWTPRNLLIWLGAIDADDRDVKTVNRDRLIQRMTDLYFDSLYGSEEKQETRRSKLARLTLDADDAAVAEVMRRVRRTSWTTATPLPYEVAQGPADADVTQEEAQRLAQPGSRPGSRVTVPPARRVKAARKGASSATTSGDAAEADPSTQAAQLVLTHDLGIREAARQVPGADPSTVRRRLQKLRETQADTPVDSASAEIPMTPIPEPTAAVTHGVNGHHFKPEEN
jgi:hypothetical protein